MKGNGMKEDKEQVALLEQALVRAYRGQRSPDLPRELQRNIMLDVQRAHGKHGTRDFHVPVSFVFGRMILPFASTAALLAAVLVIYTFTYVLPGMEQDLLAMLSEDPSGLFSAEILRR
jgi:hypothetical protein